MKNLKFVVYREDKYSVAPCLNADISSFGDTIDETIRNLKEAADLHLEGEESSAAKSENGCLMPSFVASVHLSTSRKRWKQVSN